MVGDGRTLPCKPGNSDYALDTADSMADSESDLETDGLESALDALCCRHCSSESFLKSKSYCSEFCEVCWTPFPPFSPPRRCVFIANAASLAR